MDKGNYTGMVLIDLQKAFDTVDHDILLGKLSAIGLNNSSVEWFRSYLVGRQQTVCVNDTLSDCTTVKCGVPQGSILYVNDMEAAVTCKLLLYADDSALLISGKNINLIQVQLSSQLASLSDWLVDNKLSLHLGKIESILFGSKHRLRKCSSLNVSCSPHIIYIIMHYCLN